MLFRSAIAARYRQLRAGPGRMVHSFPGNDTTVSKKMWVAQGEPYSANPGVAVFSFSFHRSLAPRPNVTHVLCAASNDVNRGTEAAVRCRTPHRRDIRPVARASDEWGKVIKTPANPGFAEYGSPWATQDVPSGTVCRRLPRVAGEARFAVRPVLQRKKASQRETLLQRETLFHREPLLHSIHPIPCARKFGHTLLLFLVQGDCI